MPAPQTQQQQQQQYEELQEELAQKETLLQQLEWDLFEARFNAATQVHLLWCKHAAAAAEQQQRRQKQRWWQWQARQQKAAQQAELTQLHGTRQRLLDELLQLNRQVRPVWSCVQTSLIADGGKPDVPTQLCMQAVTHACWFTLM